MFKHAFRLLIDNSGYTDGKTSSKYNLMSIKLIMDHLKSFQDFDRCWAMQYGINNKVN